MTEASGPLPTGAPPTAGRSRGETAARLLLLLGFLGAVVSNVLPLGGKVYVQFLLLLALMGAYALGALLSLRFWRMTAGQAAALGLVFMGFFLSVMTRGASAQSAETMLKYVLALASFPVMATLFGPLSQASRDRATVFYAAVVLLFAVGTEWDAFLSRAKPELRFLGGYNGANLHFLALAIFFYSRAFFALRRGRRQAGLVAGTAFLALTAATQSRQSILLAAFALGYLYLAMRRQRGRGRPASRNTLLLLILAGFGGLALAAGVIERFVFEFQAFGEEAPISSVERYLMLVQFWEGLSWDRLLVGFGYDAVVRKLEGTTDSIHNGYLQLVFNGGLVLFVGFCAYYWLEARRASRPWSPRRLFLLVFAAGCMFDAHIVSFQVLWLPGLVAALFPERFEEAAPASTAPAESA